jgi:hypothetical protein
VVSLSKRSIGIDDISQDFLMALVHLGAALYAGKTILFVAEKMAALEVVKNNSHFQAHLALEKTRS